MNYENSYALLKEIINKIDPIGLVDFETPESLDEYESELKEIFKKDITLLNEKELSDWIYLVFIKFFNEKLAGKKDQYDLIAKKFLERKFYKK